ncbi:MAG: hypothetical protein LBF42_01830 [Puniceicoccales bacterium]|nr:hypothetical protein [Puniceicoccales bacterium]
MQKKVLTFATLPPAPAATKDSGGGVPCGASVPVSGLLFPEPSFKEKGFSQLVSLLVFVLLPMESHRRGRSRQKNFPMSIFSEPLPPEGVIFTVGLSIADDKLKNRLGKSKLIIFCVSFVRNF